jgi:PAS domain S-box-containing protein
MKCLIREEWTGTPAKIGLLAVLTIILAVVTYFCLTSNQQVLFTHLYYIPIILAAYWYGRRGVLYAAGLSVIYLWAVFAFSTVDTQIILAASGRALFFIGIALVIALLSTVIHRQQESVIRSEEKFRGIWENIQAAVILVDPETHTIIAANPEAVKMTGFSEAEMTGHACHKFVCPAEQGKCPISDLGMKVDRAERVLLARDGKSVPVLKTVTDMTVGGKRVFIESFSDITQEKEAENTLLAFIREATLRTRNPLELVRDNLQELEEDLKGRDTTPDYIGTALAVQEKNLGAIVTNLQDLERAIVDKRTEIPEALREYLRR